MINILSEETVNKIAAGEVVERPASVVKELLENAIDAGAAAVTVEIRDGGTSFIRITDNGSGIAADEVRTAFLPHATSKIRDAEDLFSIASLGFRGEALPSIAAVSRCEMITRTADSVSGVRYVIEGGKELSFDEIGAPEGTTFIIRDLFFNTPARKKFLRSSSAESSYISDVVEKLAFSHPEVSVRLIAGGQSRIHTTGSGKLRDVIYSLFGKEMTSQLIEVKAEREGMRLGGYIGKPSLSRGTRAYELFEVNRRSVRSDVMTNAVEEAYNGYVMQHRYPVAVLGLELPAELVDVNVHPSKLEIRFEDGDRVFDFICDAVAAALKGSELIVDDTSPSVKEDAGAADAEPVKKERAPEPFEVMRSSLLREQETDGAKDVSDGQPAEETEPFVSYSALFSEAEKAETFFREITPPVAEITQEKLDSRILSPASRADFKLLGIYLDTYLLVEYENDLLMIDQHAAHEKVLYERFMKAYDARELTSQLCDPPIVLSLSQRELQAVNDNIEDLRAMGYEIESFGGRDIAVRAVPGNTLQIAREDLLIEVIDELSSQRISGSGRIVREKIAMMSCKAAVKGRMHLSAGEAEALIDELLSLDNPYNCPHGRPTAIRMSKYEIEKKFKRIV